MILRPLIAVALLGWAIQPAAAQHVKATPYIEASQVVSADLNGGDVLTYSQAGAGIDLTVDSRRVQVQISYQYQHRFAWDDQLADDDTHSGLAQAKIVVAPGLTLEGGAIATRTRADVRGDAPTSFAGNAGNVSQLYSGYAGPSLATHVGAMFVNGAYRFGYTKVETPTATGVDASEPRLDYYDDSTVHVATASVGVKSGVVLPVGLTASGSFTREDAGQLDQRFEGKWGRGDMVLPVTREVALGAGIGYETIEISQRDALLDAGGQPVLDGNGRFVTDPASPRRLAYDFDGIFWDAGVMWRPSSRTYLEARAGRRYDSWSYTGSFTHQIGPGSGIQIGVYDHVETFGQQLGNSLAGLPVGFVTTTDPFGNAFAGCIYGTTGDASGGCLNNVFASAATTAYRARGVTGIAVLNRGGTRIGLGGGYARRDFVAPEGGASLDGTHDESIYAQLFASANVGARGSVSGSVIATYYDSDLAGGTGVFSWGANTGYTHRFGQLSATATAGLSGFSREGGDEAAAQALVGLRYGF
jgi:hypothetical protein